MTYPSFKGICSAILIAAVTTLPANAEIKLTSQDGTVSFVGELVSYDGKEYVIKTVFGPLTLSALLMDCEGDECPDTKKDDGLEASLTVAGSRVILDEMLPSLLKGYAKDRGIEYLTTDDGVELRTSTGKVFADVIKVYMDGNQRFDTLKSEGVDLAFIKDAPAEGIGGFDQEVVALDGIVVAVSKVNPLSTLSTKQIAQIFSGQISNWSQVGLPAGPVRAYVPGRENAVTIGFVERILNPNQMQFGGGVLENEKAVIEAIENDPFAIGLLPYSLAENVNIVNIRGACGLQVGVSPFNILTEEYPMTQRISAFSLGSEDNRVVQDLFSFLKSNSDQEASQSDRLVGLGVQSQVNGEQGLRHLAAMLPMDIDFNLNQQRQLALAQLGGERLSTAFRFNTGSATLDTRAKTDIKRLLDFLAVGGVQNKELILFGFTDAVGDGEKNRSLSQRRAEFVRQQLLSEDTSGILRNVQIRALGYGELSPVACNQTPTDRGINRRVEVWIKDIVEQ